MLGRILMFLSLVFLLAAPGFAQGTFPQVIALSGDTVLGAAHINRIIECTAGAGGITLTLPAAATNNPSIVFVKKVDAAAGSCIIARAGSDTIDGATSYTVVPQYGWVWLASNGSAWDIIDSSNGMAGAVRYADQFPGTDAGAKITACIAALPATGGTCDARGLGDAQTAAATITVNKPIRLLLGATTLTLAGFPGINLTADKASVVGQSTHLTTLTTNSATANILQIAANFTQVSNLKFTSSVARTAGAGFYVSSGGGGNWDHLVFNPVWNGIQITNAGTGGNFQSILMREGGSGNWNAGIILGGMTSGSATISSLKFSQVEIGAGSAFADGILVLDHGLDTITFEGMEISSTGFDNNVLIIRQTSAVTFDPPRWVRFVNSTFEGMAPSAGTPTKATVLITAVKNVHFTTSYIGGGFIGLHINGANAKGIDFVNGVITQTDANSVYLQSGSYVRITNSGVGGASRKTNATYPGIRIAANQSDFWITNNEFSSKFVNANKPDYFVKVDAGTGDRYTISNNIFPAADRVTGDVSDGGTGIAKLVGFNAPLSATAWTSPMRFPVALSSTVGANPTTGGTTDVQLGGGGTSPNAGSLSWGDGAGWRLLLGYITGGTFNTAFTFEDRGRLGFTRSVAFTSLNWDLTADGTMLYCSDCLAGSNPCTGTSTGTFAFRVNGAWKCF